MPRPVVVWQLLDGKRGHERQSEGLVNALGRRIDLDIHALPIDRCRPTQAWHALARYFPEGRGRPTPDLVIGAGSACHFALLAACRAHGGRSVCLMRPGPPWQWYDAVIVPRHDRPKEAAHVFVSEGVLNPMRPAAVRHPKLALALLGGPSSHHEWSTTVVLDQLERVIARAPDLEWVVSDSRRSPIELGTAIGALTSRGVRYVPGRDCEPGWLPETLASAEQVWVTNDSVAMIFEALSAGARVGLIELPARRRDRISAIAGDLRARGWLGLAREDAPLPAAVDLDEAGRAAAWLLNRFPELGRGAVA